MANHIVETYHGRRMDIRVVAVERFGGVQYKVQYQYSKKNNTWLNYTSLDYNKGSEANDNCGYFYNISKAKAAARRKLNNNNQIGSIGMVR